MIEKLRGSLQIFEPYTGKDGLYGIFEVIRHIVMHIENTRTYIVLTYNQKYLTRLGELIIFEPWRENYHFSQPS